jgi:hypothetical protein
VNGRGIVGAGQGVNGTRCADATIVDVRIIVDGCDLPGARFVSDGALFQNVHVAVQVGEDPVEPVRGDAASARWELDVRAVLDDGGVDLRGPSVHGKKGDRFLYLTWGDVGRDGSFQLFARRPQQT